MLRYLGTKSWRSVQLWHLTIILVWEQYLLAFRCSQLCVFPRLVFTSYHYSLLLNISWGRVKVLRRLAKYDAWKIRDTGVPSPSSLFSLDETNYITCHITCCLSGVVTPFTFSLIPAVKTRVYFLTDNLTSITVRRIIVFKSLIRECFVNVFVCYEVVQFFGIEKRHRCINKGTVKVKLSLCFLLTEHHAMKAYWGSGGIVPVIFWTRH
jgi:hypothetical protein